MVTPAFHPDLWLHVGRGPRYAQLYRYLVAEIASGTLSPETQLPPERELASLAQVSRVTLRKAVTRLVAEGVLEQRRGAGTFVRSPQARRDPSLSRLLSFTDYMLQRGKKPSSAVINRGLYHPSPDEQVALGLSSIDRVVRLERLRAADGIAMAVEWCALPQDILPEAQAIGGSLYDYLRANGTAPARVVQRVMAVNLAEAEAGLLKLAAGTAVLRIDRTGFLPSGRPIEFTRGLYRSDIYDFVAEMRLEAHL